MTIRNPSPLAATLLAAMEQENITQLELAERSGVSARVVGSILRDEVEEVKASYLSRLAATLKLPFWRLLYLALGLDDLPEYTPDEEARRIAAIVEADESMREILKKLQPFSPENRRAVLAYVELLQRQSSDPRSPRGSG